LAISALHEGGRSRFFLAQDSISKMNGLRKVEEATGRAVRTLEADEESAGQRLDNFLVRILKGVPRSHLYRMVRTGEVRVNSRRVDVTYRISAGDRIRIPPVRTAAPASHRPAAARAVLSQAVLLEDEHLLALDKPAGMAVHGGSGVSRGVIEQLRLERPQARFLELVHRLDRETSGVLLLAKKRSALVDLHAQIREGRVEKRYLVLVKGEWRRPRQTVVLPLTKFVTQEGERRVSVDTAGMHAETTFSLEQGFAGFSLLGAQLHTGRTHQIRVHLAHLGFPIAGDDKYGDFALNRALARGGLKRMFLHAAELGFKHPATGEPMRLRAGLPAELAAFIATLEPPTRAAGGHR
jgi:23S rRNA pseudouridine955/2504/2580 synthase